MKKTRLTWLLGTSLVIILGAAFARYVVHRPGQNLNRFLGELATVELSKTTLQEWRENLQSAQVANVEFSCDQRVCIYTLRQANSYLHKFKLAPLTLTVSGVSFTDGMASEVDATMVVQGNVQGMLNDDKGLVIREKSERPNSCNQHYQAQVGKRYSPGDRSWGTISMDRCVSATERAKAFALNVGCLSKVGGCKTAEEMNPQVFASR